MTPLATVGWATYVQEVRYVAGAWIAHDCRDAGGRATQEQLPRSDRCPPLSKTGQMVGNLLPTLREHHELF